MLWELELWPKERNPDLDRVRADYDRLTHSARGREADRPNTADQPKVAVAVVVENGGFGGASAAPIAKTVMQAILRRP